MPASTAPTTRLRRALGRLQPRALAAEVVEFFNAIGRLHHEDEEPDVFPRLTGSGRLDRAQRLVKVLFLSLNDSAELPKMT